MRLGTKGRIYRAAKSGNRRRAFCALLTAAFTALISMTSQLRAETLPPLSHNMSANPVPPLQNAFGTNDSSVITSMTVAQLQAMAAKKLNNRDLVAKFIGKLPDWMQRIEVNGNFDLSGWRGFEAVTVQPIWQSDDKKKICFTQLSGVSYRMFDLLRFAGNAGVGYRQLLLHDRMLAGANVFYDYEFLRGHRRTGIGGEMKFGPFDFTANGYFGFSARSAPDGTVEKVPSGFDLEAGSQMPYMPWARVYGKFYRWDHKIDDHQVMGAQFSVEANVHRAVSVEAGTRQDQGRDAEGFMMLRIKLNQENAQNLFDSPILDKRVFADRDLSKLMLSKVRRENRIILERSDPMSAGGGLTVTVSRGN
ncbi:MAG: inverse autotransporter beta domain-containing protein [Alphaproteobacteria bacterium]